MTICPPVHVDDVDGTAAVESAEGDAEMTGGKGGNIIFSVGLNFGRGAGTPDGVATPALGLVVSGDPGETLMSHSAAAKVPLMMVVS